MDTLSAASLASYATEVVLTQVTTPPFPSGIARVVLSGLGDIMKVEDANEVWVKPDGPTPCNIAFVGESPGEDAVPATS